MKKKALFIFYASKIRHLQKQNGSEYRNTKKLYSKLYNDIENTNTQYLQKDNEETIYSILETKVKKTILPEEIYKASENNGITNKILRDCLDCLDCHQLSYCTIKRRQTKNN